MSAICSEATFAWEALGPFAIIIGPFAIIIGPFAIIIGIESAMRRIVFLAAFPSIS